MAKALDEIELRRDHAIDVLSVAMQAAQDFLFDDVTKKARQRRPQAEMLMNAIEDLGLDDRRTLAVCLDELAGRGGLVGR